MADPRRQLAIALLAGLVLALGGCGGDDERASTTPAAESGRPSTVAPEPATTATATAAEPEEPEPEADLPRPRAVAIQHGPRRGKRIALTFDADMTADMRERVRRGEVGEQYSRELIETLRRTRTPATLFLTGMWARMHPRETRDLAEDPLFEIANHTYDHRAWTSDCYGLAAVSSEEDKRAEVERTARVIEELTGRAPHWFRFPGLCHDDADLRLVARAGEQAVDGVGSGDAFNEDASSIVDQVLGQLEPGMIVVAHMTGPPNAPATAEAIERLIPALEERGYEPVTLGELLARR